MAEGFVGYVAKRTDACVRCGYCIRFIKCPGEDECVGCGACVEACPFEARVLVPDERPRGYVRIRVDGESYHVPERITVLRALELIGYRISRVPWEGDIYAPCRTGGCWACAVVIDGKLAPSCVTPVRDGMSISTDREEAAKFEPLRLVSGFMGHRAGGVGTPYWVKPEGIWRYIEAACFSHGCILRCPTCQNWRVTYASDVSPMTPREAAEMMTMMRHQCMVDRMAISGGECTLNRRWLVEFIKQLRRMNRDPRARFHVDTNAVVLTPDYIDELREAGMTDIGPDVKGLELKTFMRITGVRDEGLARQLLETEWAAIKYLLDRYWGEVFIGVGIPYNPKLISLEEVGRIGERLASWEPDVQVCVLDYRPEFRAKDIRRPKYREMVEVKDVLESAGLRCVICQTEYGHIGPGPAPRRV